MDRVPVRDELADVEPYGAPQLDVPVRLNTNETPFRPPDAFFEQLAKRVAALDLQRYPDRRAWALRTELGRRFGLPPGRVWAANGSNEILQQLLQAYGGSGRRLLVFRPGYSMYPLLAKATATPMAVVDLDRGGYLDETVARRAAETEQPDIVFLDSPNNPTGITAPLGAVRQLHEHSRALVVVDEAYVEFGGDSAVALLDELPRLAVCRTFSKAWRLAGLRLGYLLAHEWVVDDLRKVRLPYHLDALTQAAGLTALELADDVTAHVEVLVGERERLVEALRQIGGVEVWEESRANFLLFSTAVPDLFDRLLAKGVLVRDFSREPLLDGCLRVTVGTRGENDTFLTALRECLQ
ncbi:MAG: histidinol-phosphate transaminase [Nitriliruptorales bacterium]|nr:histidinol-phosphate transaminase [Nitriliruptorales bacterium]